MPLAYFTRHGRVEDGENISKIGKIELLSTLLKLSWLRFRPAAAFSSSAPRCVQTAKILAPKAEIKIQKSLFKFGPFSKFRGLTDEMIEPLIPELEKGNDILVVCHDSAAAVLALRLVELRGGTVNWNTLPREILFLDQGEGILVEGTEWILLPSGFKTEK